MKPFTLTRRAAARVCLTLLAAALAFAPAACKRSKKVKAQPTEAAAPRQRRLVWLTVGCGGIAIAAHGGDYAIYPHCREEFMRAMGEAMQAGTYARIQLLRPFIALTKGQIATEGARLGVDFARTWSCYQGGARHCGKCGTCVERREAFAVAGLADPTEYEATPALPEKP